MGKKKKDGLYYQVTVLKTLLELYQFKLLCWFFIAFLNLLNHEG